MALIDFSSVATGMAILVIGGVLGWAGKYINDKFLSPKPFLHIIRYMETVFGDSASETTAYISLTNTGEARIKHLKLTIKCHDAVLNNTRGSESFKINTDEFEGRLNSVDIYGENIKAGETYQVELGVINSSDANIINVKSDSKNDILQTQNSY